MPPKAATNNPEARPLDDATTARMLQLEEQLQAVLNQQTALQQENAQLQQTVRELQVPAGTRSPSLTPIPEDATPAPRFPSETPTFATSARFVEPKVAQPEYFNGQRGKLTTFITQCSLVFAMQGSRFPDETSKVYYAGSFLRDTAFLWFQPYVTADPQPGFMKSWTLFKVELKSMFGDPDEIATAERQLYNLKQRSSVSSYMADFTRYSVLVKWNSEALSAQFYRGLKDVIKDEIMRTGKPQGLRELQDLAIRIDTRLFERQVEKGDRYSSSTPYLSTTSLRTGGSRPFLPRFQNTSSTYSKPESLHVAFASSRSQMTRKGRLTPEEYQRRKDNNLCLYCGDKDHVVLQCPVAPPARKFTGPRSASSHSGKD